MKTMERRLEKLKTMKNNDNQQKKQRQLIKNNATPWKSINNT